MAWAGSVVIWQSSLHFANVGCLRSFRTLHDVKLDRVTFGQRLETFALNRGVMDEHVVAVFPRNEPETLAVVEPFDGTFRHDPLPLLYWGKSVPLVRWPTWPVKQVDLFFECPMELIRAVVRKKARCFLYLQCILRHSAKNIQRLFKNISGKN